MNRMISIIYLKLFIFELFYIHSIILDKDFIESRKIILYLHDYTIASLPLSLSLSHLLNKHRFLATKLYD